LPPSDNSLWLPLLLSMVLAVGGWIAGIIVSGHPMRGEVINAWRVASSRVFRRSSSSK